MAIPATLSQVPAQTPYIQYVATNGQTVFPYPFEITQDSDLVVVANGTTLGTDSGYTVSGVGASTGGNITFTSGRALNDIITLFRDIPIERLTQFAQNGGFSSTAFNAEFNNIYLLLQQLQSSIDQCLQIPNTNNPAPTVSLTPASYANKYLAFDSNGNPTPAALTSSGSLTAQIIGSVYRPTQSWETGVVDNFYDYGDLRRFGLPTDGSDDGSNSTRIQNAITSATASGGNGFIFHPGGTIAHALQISVPNGLTVLGWNRAYCIFKFTGSPGGSPASSRSAWRYTSGVVNGSGYANVHFRGVQIWYQNAINFAAAIELNAGGWSYFEIDDCWIKGACSYGLILDAVEICSVHNCLIENTNSTANTNVWIVNGADRSAGQSTGFSNVITIRENQISGGTGAFGLVDDGGNAHTVASNNFNQHRFPATYAGVTGLKTHGNSYETTLQTGSANVFFTAVTSAGNPVGPCSGISMEADGFYGNISSGALLAFQGSVYTITGITQASSAVITVNAGGSVNPFSVNAPVFVTSVSGMTQINGTVSTVTAVGGSTGAWTATLNRNSSSFSAYTSGGQAQMMHSGVSVKACNFGSQLGRGAAIDVTYLSNSICEANNDAGTASMFHYTGVHNDNCGNRLMPPQNGALPALNISGPTYGDTRYQQQQPGGINVTGLNIDSAEWQNFVIVFTNTSGTIQHKIVDSWFGGDTCAYADKINSANSTLANTPTVSSSVGFTNGAGLLSGSTNVIIFDTATQDSAKSNVGADVVYYDGNDVAVRVDTRIASYNVNGVSQNRVTMQLTNSMTGIGVTLDTTLIPSGKSLAIRVRGYVK